MRTTLIAWTFVFALGVMWALLPLYSFPRRLPAGADLSSLTFAGMVSLTGRCAQGALIVTVAAFGLTPAGGGTAVILVGGSALLIGYAAFQLFDAATVSEESLRRVRAAARAAAWLSAAAALYIAVEGLMSMRAQGGYRGDTSGGAVMLVRALFVMLATQIDFTLEEATEDLITVLDDAQPARVA
jgi:hypothetical protein